MYIGGVARQMTFVAIATTVPRDTLAMVVAGRFIGNRIQHSIAHTTNAGPRPNCCQNPLCLNSALRGRCIIDLTACPPGF
jgi:hypothetical protein